MDLPLTDWERAGMGIERDVSLSKMTTMGVGGPASLAITVRTCRQVTLLFPALVRSDLPWMVLGKGANTLFSDKGFPGVIVKLGGIFEKSWITGSRLVCGAGTSLHRAVRQAVEAGLGGMEKMAGFPSTVGGAVIMNAGCYGQEIGDVLEKVILARPEGGLTGACRDSMKMDYRRSSLADTGIILFASFHLTPGDPETLNEEMDKIIRTRSVSVPPGRSSGSIFKNPPGKTAWELIRESSLAGYRLGDAEIAFQHANVILNTGSATAAQVYMLIRQIREKVFTDHGVILETEIRIVGFPPLD